MSRKDEKYLGHKLQATVSRALGYWSQKWGRKAFPPRKARRFSTVHSKRNTHGGKEAVKTPHYSTH